MEKIENNIMRLSEFSLSGSFVEDENLKNKGYRKLVIQNYIVEISSSLLCDSACFLPTTHQDCLPKNLQQ